jgi:phosphomannomutase
MTRFLFDIDGTLTDSRQKIDPEFEQFMLDFCASNKVAFVTGSDKPKTVEQIGSKLFNRVDYSFNCAGNEIWSQDKLISKTEWSPPQELIDYLNGLLYRSKFQFKTGRHIELRNGMINFSIPGRNCDSNTRADYIGWDKSTDERMNLREKLDHRFGDLDVFVGGDTGLDIYPKGKNKEQVLEFLKTIEREKTYYFGDQIFRHGNDYNIAMKCDHRYSVRAWRNTHEILSFLKEAGYCE